MIFNERKYFARTYFNSSSGREKRNPPPCIPTRENDEAAGELLRGEHFEISTFRHIRDCMFEESSIAVAREFKPELGKCSF